MFQTFDVGFVSRRRRGRGLLMLNVARKYGSQHGRNIVATWRGGGKKYS
jgi:hypothetical protein